MSGTHMYGTRLRPPDIGCVPKQGLKDVSFAEFEAVGRHYWGTATYDRELTQEELEHFDMDCIGRVYVEGKREE